MDQLIQLFRDNGTSITNVYYIFAVVGALYAFFRFIKKLIVKTDSYNLLRLIKETPELIVDIKKGQSEIYKEIK